MPAVTWIVAVAQIAPTAPIMMETAVRIVPETMMVARTATILLAVVTAVILFAVARLLSAFRYRIMRSDSYSASGFSTISRTP
jgi:hypothetical protein